MSDSPLVYISVLNWNRCEQTIDCLRSLSLLDYPNFRIVVVDNASVDGSVTRLRQTFPDVTLIESDANRGYAGGHRLAVDYALQHHADLIWLLNNDLRVEPAALRRLVEAYQSSGDALYGSIPLEMALQNDDLNSALVTFPLKYFRKDFRQELFVLRPFRKYGELFADTFPREVSGLPGSSLMIPARVIERHGFMDETFFLYAEEIDYCFRLRRQGVASIIVPASIVFHRKSQSTAINPALRHAAVYYRTRNQLLFIKRHNHPFFFVWGLTRNVLLMGAHCVLKGGKGVQTARFMARGMVDALQNRSGKTIAPEALVGPGHSAGSEA